jgi:hypothetical protein
VKAILQQTVIIIRCQNEKGDSNHQKIFPFNPPQRHSVFRPNPRDHDVTLVNSKPQE